MTSASVFAVAGGQAAVYSHRCPGKVSPCEDVAAIIPLGRKSCVFAVADGMGGHDAGEVASRLAVAEVIRSVVAVKRRKLKPRIGIIDGFENANTAVHALDVDAGTTLAALEVRGDTVRSYHTGDTIVLVINESGLLKMETVSHSPVGYGLAAGLLTGDEAMDHEDRHLIYNAVGSQLMTVEVGTPIQIAPDDTVLLASDGLTDNVTLEETLEIARAHPVEEATNQLATLARQRMEEGLGGPSKPDDIAIMLFRRVGKTKTAKAANGAVAP